MQNNEWVELVNTAKKFLKNFAKKEKYIIESLAKFSEEIVRVSSIYTQNRNLFFKFFNDYYINYSIQCSKILLCADSASNIMQLNDGLNDNLILINIFKELLFLLDELKYRYLQTVLFILIENNEISSLKDCVLLLKNSKFGKKDSLNNEIINIFKKKRIKRDKFYEEYLNKDLWRDIEMINKDSLDTINYGSNFIKEIISKDEEFEDDMIINIWALLAINICYVDYLNSLK
ncbi:hypothetical protein SCORR_v1c08640 [Spiroplasma corruscae]|uniref:Uncharacterized protein n=1 Tax=Spiroplasma corruscae TaxID=216934 RepID=A0A222EQA3_9MOLU|nr:hypothetical protein [Spiroplasma corruscae]ASP28636.1 hypothetical protein SCORR_v1c08640 [Spiroplasma corruscae]